jgi:hypothetical protein
MIVDSLNRFLTIRQYPKMSLIRPAFVFPTRDAAAAEAAGNIGVDPSIFNAVEPDALVLNAPGMSPLTIPLASNGRGPASAAELVTATIWSDSVVSEVVSKSDAATPAEQLSAVGDWLSAFLGAKGLRLVQCINRGNTAQRKAPAAGAEVDEKKAAAAGDVHRRVLGKKFNINEQTAVQTAFADGFPFLVILRCTP